MAASSGQFWPASGGGSAGHTIQDEGIELTARTRLNFAGSGVTATDDGANDQTLVTITGGGLDQATADTRYVNVTGDTVSGPLLVSSVLEVIGGNNIRFRGNSGTTNGVSFFGGETGTSLRWWLKRNGTAEAGSNVGSDFQLDAYDDAGAFLSNPFVISRATGLITVKGDPTALLGVVTKQYADARAIPVGGTSGQVLTKNSATDRDVAWTTISGGGGGPHPFLLMGA